MKACDAPPPYSAHYSAQNTGSPRLAFLAVHLSLQYWYWQYRVKTNPKKPTRVAAPSPRASLGRRTVCGRTEQRRPQGSKRCKTKVKLVWGRFLIAAAALKTPTRNGSNAQGSKLKSHLGRVKTPTRTVYNL